MSTSSFSERLPLPLPAFPERSTARDASATADVSMTSFDMEFRFADVS